MPKYQRIILAILGAILALALIATLAINLHLQSPSTQNNLRQAALDTIGMPLTIRSASYTPWDGIRLRGIVIPDMENEGINFLEASEFQVFFRLLPLLHQEFIASKVLLKEAVLTWRQNNEGQWSIPREALAASSHPKDLPIASSSPTPETDTAPTHTTPPHPFGIHIEQLGVVHSRILFENRDGWPLFDASGIQSRTIINPDNTAHGTAKISEAVIAGLVVANDLSSDFTLNKGLLSFPIISGDVSGGELTGNGTITTAEAGSPYKWLLQLSNYPLNRLHLPDKSGALQLDGTLNATFEIHGRNAPQRHILGTGHLEVHNGHITPPPFLQEVGRFFDIPALRGTDLKAAHADLRLENDLVHLSPLWLQAKNIALELTGTITRGGNLDLKGRLFLDSETAASITARTKKEIALADNPELPDFHVLPFKITGTLRNPDSDLAERLIGSGIGSRVGNFLLNILRSR